MDMDSIQWEFLLVLAPYSLAWMAVIILLFRIMAMLVSWFFPCSLLRLAFVQSFCLMWCGATVPISAFLAHFGGYLQVLDGTHYVLSRIVGFRRLLPHSLIVF